MDRWRSSVLKKKKTAFRWKRASVFEFWVSRCVENVNTPSYWSSGSSSRQINHFVWFYRKILQDVFNYFLSIIFSKLLRNKMLNFLTSVINTSLASVQTLIWSIKKNLIINSYLQFVNICELVIFIFTSTLNDLAAYEFGCFCTFRVSVAPSQFALFLSFKNFVQLSLNFTLCCAHPRPLKSSHKRVLLRHANICC